MGTAFSIQVFFIPVIKKHTNEKKHLLILFMAYVLGICAYYYIAYMGSFGKNDFRQVFNSDHANLTARQSSATLVAEISQPK